MSLCDVSISCIGPSVRPLVLYNYLSEKLGVKPRIEKRKIKQCIIAIGTPSAALRIMLNTINMSRRGHINYHTKEFEIKSKFSEDVGSMADKIVIVEGEMEKIEETGKDGRKRRMVTLEVDFIVCPRYEVLCEFIDTHLDHDCKCMFVSVFDTRCVRSLKDNTYLLKRFQERYSDFVLRRMAWVFVDCDVGFIQGIKQAFMSSLATGFCFETINKHSTPDDIRRQENTLINLRKYLMQQEVRAYEIFYNRPQREPMHVSHTGVYQMVTPNRKRIVDFDEDYYLEEEDDE